MFRCCNKFIWSALALLACIGCEDPHVTKYTAPREKNTQDFTRLDSYKLPEGWKRADKPVELSVATFHIGEGNKSVIVTVSRFPGNVGGLAANIERWRGKVGLAKSTDEQLFKEIKMLMVGGEKTPYVDLSNPDKKDADRILGVFAERGSVTWVFKMQGPPDEVGAQKTAFENFLGSIKFGGTGASDG